MPFASAKPLPSETQARGFTKAQVVFRERLLCAKHKKSYPLQALPTLSPIAFHDYVKGVTTPAHASWTVVSINLQCPVPWLRNGDPVVVGQPAERFVRITDPSKLDEYADCVFDNAISLEMFDRVVAEVTFPMDHWDPIFAKGPRVHRGPDAGDRRILSAWLPRTRGDIEYFDITYHDLLATTYLSNPILEFLRKALDYNLVQVNHYVVDCLLCPLLIATQNEEPHREVPSQRGSLSACMVYIPI